MPLSPSWSPACSRRNLMRACDGCCARQHLAGAALTHSVRRDYGGTPHVLRGQAIGNIMPVDQGRCACSAGQGRAPDGAPLPKTGTLSDIVASDGKVFFSITVDAAVVQAWEPVRKRAEEAVKAIPGVHSAMVALTAERNGGARCPHARPPQGAPHGGAAAPATRMATAGAGPVRRAGRRRRSSRSPPARAASASPPPRSISRSACAISG